MSVPSSVEPFMRNCTFGPEVASQLGPRHQALAVGGAAEVDGTRALDQRLVEVEERGRRHGISRTIAAARSGRVTGRPRPRGPRPPEAAPHPLDRTGLPRVVRVPEDPQAGAQRAELLERGVVVEPRFDPLERGSDARVGQGSFHAGPQLLIVSCGFRLWIVARTDPRGSRRSCSTSISTTGREAAKPSVVVRGRTLSLTMSAYLEQEILRQPNIELRLETEVVDADGAPGLEQVVLKNRKTGACESIATPALFVMIGAMPHTEWLGGVLERDRNGFILTGDDVPPEARGAFDDRPPALLETSLPRVFAAGDVRYGSTKRIASAIGEAAVAIRVVHEALRTEAEEEPSVPRYIPDEARPSNP